MALPGIGRAATPFFGRTKELSELLALHVRGEPLVTLVGTSGVGKTRLATEHASKIEHAFADEGGAWFCDLTEARTQDAVCGAVARTLHVANATQLSDALATRGRTLLVLDNCEQAIGPIATLVRSWIERCPELRLSCTSRERLGVGAEVVFEVHPLEADGVALFREIVRRRAPSVTLGEGDDETIAKIVRRLDGIPLAIELAAARLSVLSPGSLLARLESTLDLLRTNARDLHPRQATLRGAIEWSWSLLEPHEQAALRQCAVFRGGFTIEAAEAVVSLDASGKTLDAIHALRDKSLLRTASDDGNVRLALYESVREFATEKLDASDEREATLRRHAHHYAEKCGLLSSELVGPNGAQNLRALTRELDNLLAIATAACDRRDDPAWISDALGALIAAYPIFLARGPVSAYLALVDPILEASEQLSIDSVRRARVLAYRAHVDASSPRAERDLAEAWSLVERSDDLRARAEVRSLRAAVASAASDFERAQAEYLEVIELSRAANDRGTEGRTLGNLAIVARERGDTAEAEKRAREAIEVLAKLGDRRFEGYHRGTLASVLHMTGRLEEAGIEYARAIELLRGADDRRLLGACLGNCALLLQEQGELDRALAHCREATSLLRALGLRAQTDSWMGYLGGIHHERGEEDEAYRLYDLASRSQTETRYAWLFLARRATIDADRGRQKEATEALDRADARLRAANAMLLLHAIDLHRGHLEIASNRPDDARRRLEAAERDSLRLSDDVRFAHRMLARKLGAYAPATGSIAISNEARRVVLPDGTHVDLETRPALRSLLLALAHHRLSHPGEPMTTNALVAAGWPGEKIQAKAAASRLYMSMTRLRQLGLESLLKRRDDGYMLDPDVPLVLD